MNNYHLYEEIGHGKYTVVYKGRKRYSIEYVGVKSTEKCRRSRVMNEVAVLNDIKGHFNVLRFHNWYETRNHLWIITEYCAGGDLLKVLKQDSKVSPDQCRAFCLDIISGLHHVHRNGIIYGDLKPSNLLFTEEGRLKLCDFGMSQRLTDLENLSAKGKPLPRRGTPYYMAPELFLDRGVHSFASDLWALGIVMHELVTGRPPFVSNSFQSLQHLIKEEDPKPDITPLSSTMADLVHGRARGGGGDDDSLLAKDPVTRLDWAGLLSHPFWKGQFDHLLDVELPPQKHFSDYVKTSHRLHYPGSSSIGRNATSTSSQRLNPLTVQTPSSEMLRSETPSVVNQPTPPTRRHTIQQLVFHPSAPSESRRVTVAAAITKLLPHWSDQSVSPISTGQEEDAVPSDSSSDFVDEGASSPAGGKENLRGWENRLPFKAFDRDAFVVAITQSATSAALNKEVHHHIAVIHQQLRSATSPDLVHAIIAYLNHLSERVEIADVVLNSSILSLLLVLASPPDKEADHASRSSRGQWTIIRRSEALRIDTLNMLGKALRHASFIEPGCTTAGGSHSMMVGASVVSHHSEAGASGLSFDTLTNGAHGGYGLFEMLQQCIEPSSLNSLAIRRGALAALGELMFYVATQQQSPTAAAADTTANSILSACSSSSLDLPPSVVSIFMQTCLVNGDDLEVHGLLMLAAQTLRNIALMAPDGWVSTNLLTPNLAAQVLGRLAKAGCDSAVSPRVRVTCLAALDRTLNLVPSPFTSSELLQVCMSGLRLAARASAESDAQRAVSSGVSFGLRLLGSHARLDATTAEGLVGEILSVLGQPRLSSVSRGKAIVLLARLFLIRGPSTDNIGAHALHCALDKNLAMRFERICRAPDAVRDADSEDEDTASYLQRALSVVIDAVSICLWQCLTDAVTDLHALTTSNPTPSPRYSSSRSGTSSTSASSSASLRRGSAASSVTMNISRALNIIMHLLANSNMARCVLTESHLPSVARIAAWQTPCGSPRSGTNAGLQHLQLLMIEGLPAQVGVLLEGGPPLCDCFVRSMLPSIISHTHSELADVRFRAFKSLSDIIMQMLADDETYNVDGALRARLTSLLREQLLPLLGVLLGDDEPTPTLVRRLLSVALPDKIMTPMVKYRR
ncbi:Serine threonine kinase [Perkinsus olseni]|uniref:Serine threonine kinase n=1 Tax=Perkinsus olseni TaxID=32597 RepID=A0A7J6TS93_PEROL|nr:Serine threonine kinase [Perkinsus olseni]KAF4753610.1 Serine threonine kinase [Perkinsus olseni]